MQKKKLAFLILLSFHFALCALSGTLGWNRQIFIVPVVSIVSMVIGYKKFELSAWLSLLLTTPFFLIYTWSSLFLADTSFITYPIWIIGILVSILTFIFLKYKLKLTLSIFILTFIVLLGGLFIWPNTFTYAYTEKKPSKYSLRESILVDSVENRISFDQFRGKVILFDIWHSACLPCIKQFPEVQKLYEYYKGDTTVKIISLNFPLKKDNGVRPTKLTDKYSFEKLYFLNEQGYRKIREDGLPLVLIMDKNMICRYAGQFNMKWNIFLGNAKRIIKRLKNE